MQICISYIYEKSYETYKTIYSSVISNNMIHVIKYYNWWAQSMLFYFRGKRNQCELIILKSFIEDLVFALVLERWAQFQYICHTKDLYWFHLDAEKEAKDSFQLSCKDNLGSEVSLWEKDAMHTGLRGSKECRLDFAKCDVCSCSRGGGNRENGASEEGGLKSTPRPALFTASDSLYSEVKKGHVTQAKFSWVQAASKDKDKLPVAQTCYSSGICKE